ncbi:uncharacterized protein [Ptychodera flava]|uniref:uncharacterized protein n=1 Tax=Ptychodera flava TaxID=63121 RepID=UPI00396A7B41
MPLSASFEFCLWILLWRSSLIFGQQLGRVIDDKVLDDLFRKMGQAYVDEFQIEEENLVFDVVAEDTIGEAEFWVVDFQPYKYNEDALPVDPDNGDIIADNTGQCSNVMPVGTFSANGAGFYFTDDGNFVTRNVSIVDAKEGNFKRLFSSYVRGPTYSEPDQYGQNVTKRDYHMKYRGNLGFFFNCTNSNGDNIWTYQNTTDTIEYQTTVYVTNVRPIDPTDGTQGFGFVSSSISLIYRLSRIAIANFVLSSSPLIKPIIDFVIADGALLYYLNGTENYQPENNQNSLARHLNFTLPIVLEPCIFVTSDQCIQTWNFELILNVDDSVVEDDMPIDATGVFTFQYKQYQCSDTTTEPPTGCAETIASTFTISMDITLQTVVIVRDAERDYPSLYLLSITGTNGNDLRGGVRAGNRGVNHLEPVNMKIQMLPEFLRDLFNLELTLFMVCKEDQTANLGGCLDVDVGNRYIAYKHDDFRFTAVDDNGDDQSYSFSDLSLDAWQPDGDNTTQQYLDYHGYDQGTNIYDIDFTNSALSQERLEYTITTVFRLNEKTEGVLTPARRKRSFAERYGRDGRDNRVLMVHRTVYTRSAPDSAIVRRDAVRGSRQRRDIMTRARDPTDHHVAFMYAGCPEGSLFDESTYSCMCTVEDEYYSEKSFTCVSSKNIGDTPSINPSSGDKLHPYYTLYFNVILFLALSAYLSI